MKALWPLLAREMWPLLNCRTLSSLLAKVIWSILAILAANGEKAVATVGLRPVVTIEELEIAYKAVASTAVTTLP